MRKLIVVILVVIILWLIHPVCQFNIPDKNAPDGYRVTWKTLYSPSGIIRFLTSQKITDNGLEGYCKTWIGEQLFF